MMSAARDPYRKAATTLCVYARVSGHPGILSSKIRMREHPER